MEGAAEGGQGPGSKRVSREGPGVSGQQLGGRVAPQGRYEEEP